MPLWNITFVSAVSILIRRLFTIKVHCLLVLFYFSVPTLPPTSCSGFNISKNEIKILWGAVPRADRNGIILGYNIYTTEVYNYFATMPADYSAPEKGTIVNTTEEPARSFVQHRLLPYTDYSFQVDAFTSKGNGPNCSAFIVRTEEEGIHDFIADGIRICLKIMD